MAMWTLDFSKFPKSIWVVLWLVDFSGHGPARFLPLNGMWM